MILDKVLKDFNDSNPYQKEGKDLLLNNKPVILRIQNVADYYFSVSDNEFIFDEMNDNFPNIAPPWKCFWLEYLSPAKMNTGGKVLDWDSSFNLGTLVLAEKSEKDGWGLGFHHYLHKENRSQYAGSVLITCDDRGIPKVMKHPTIPGKIIVMGHNPFKDDEIHNSNINLAQVCMMAISFCHCKNVVINTTKLGHGQLKKRKKHGKPSVYAYHTLNIEPMKKVFRANGAGNSIKKGLHICRGHFKDYRGSQGLFGKHKDIYWWDSHVKGTNADRIIEKEYNIKTKESD